MTVPWGHDGPEPTLVEAGPNAPAGEALCAAADCGGAEVTVAYAQGGLLTVEFLDEQAQASAIRPSSVMTAAGLPLTEVEASASWALGAMIGAVTPDLGPAVPATFTFTHDIENIEGSRANDVLLGDGDTNRLFKGGGDDFADARGGVDTAVLQGEAMEYFLALQPDGGVAALRFVPVSLLQPDGMEYVRLEGVAFLQFADRIIRIIDIPAQMITGDTLPDAAMADSHGTSAFADTVADAAGQGAEGVVDIAVSPIRDAPRSAGDAFVAKAGSTARLDVLANDADPDGLAPLTLQDVAVIGGSATAEVVDNVISFNAAAAGLVRLRYTVALGEEIATAEVTVDVGANINAMPELAGDFAAFADEGGSDALTDADLGATDANGDPVTFRLSGVTNGSVLLSGVEATSFVATDAVKFQHDGSGTITGGFDVMASDGKAETAVQRFSVAVTPVNDAPILTGAGAPVTYVENAASLLIVPNLTLADPDGTTLHSAKVVIASPLPEDRLVVANWRPENGQTTTMGNITLHYTNGVLLLAGMASLAEYQGVLRMVGYANASDRPDSTPRSITVTVDDGSGQNAEGSVAATVEIVPQDDAASGWVALIDGDGALAILTDDAGLIDADPAGPLAPSFVWSSSATPGGVQSNVGSGTSLTLPNEMAPRYVSVDGVYEDEFGTHRIDGAGVALVGTAQADILSTEGVDIVLGLGGNDRILLAPNSAPDLIVDGGVGLDTLVVGEGVADYGPADDAALIRVEAVLIENTAGAHVDLSSQSEDFTITGGTGADTIMGGLGSDRIAGGEGDDVFLGFDGDGSDAWIGGAGSDTISFDSVEAAVNINLVAQTAQGSTTGSDTLSSIEHAVGGAGADTVLGNDAANRLDGGDGDDLIRGGGGADTIKGGGGNDRIFGDGGSDVLSGGEGDDSFCFSDPGGGMDIITDFQPGDRLEITGSTFLRGLTNDQISSGSWFFKGLAAQDLDDRLIYDRDSGYLIYDSNGNRDGGTILQIARFDSDDDLSNGFNGCDLDWWDFIIT